MGAEMRAGRSFVDALGSMADRLIIPEARSLVALLRQSRELGSDIGDALRVFSDEMRDKRLLRAEEQANKLAVKMTIPLALFIFPVVLLVIMLPIAVRLLTSDSLRRVSHLLELGSAGVVRSKKVIEQMPALSPSVRLDHAFLLRLADWLVVLVAISLPWSTTATGICIAAWLVVVLPGLDLESVRREVASARGGLPVALWCLGLIGMIWAGVDWTQRFEGLAGFHRLLVIPLLLAQFRRSDHGERVICGFLLSSAIVLVVSYILIIVPGLSPRDKVVGIPMHDDIFQGSIFIICGFGALGYAATEGIKRQLLVAFAFVVIAALFLANFLFVPIFSRIVLAVAPVLAGLLGWRLSRWRGLLGTFVLAVALSVAFWFASLNLRAHVYNSLDEFREYNARNTATSIGRHVAFLNESLEIISSAPLIGHGTGSIAEEFRQVTSAKNGAAGVATVIPTTRLLRWPSKLGLSARSSSGQCGSPISDCFTAKALSPGLAQWLWSRISFPRLFIPICSILLMGGFMSLELVCSAEWSCASRANHG